MAISLDKKRRSPCSIATSTTPRTRTAGRTRVVQGLCWGPAWQAIGRALAVLFCITLVVATITGISFFQMWNVANITESYFGIPGVCSSIVMAMLVALVVIGGIDGSARSPAGWFPS